MYAIDDVRRKDESDPKVILVTITPEMDAGPTLVVECRWEGGNVTPIRPVEAWDEYGCEVCECPASLPNDAAEWLRESRAVRREIEEMEEWS